MNEDHNARIHRLAQKIGWFVAKYTLAFLRRYQRLKHPTRCSRPWCGKEWKKQISGVRFCNRHYPLRNRND